MPTLSCNLMIMVTRGVSITFLVQARTPLITITILLPKLSSTIPRLTISISSQTVVILPTRNILLSQLQSEALPTSRTPPPLLALPFPPYTAFHPPHQPSAFFQPTKPTWSVNTIEAVVSLLQAACGTATPRQGVPRHSGSLPLIYYLSSHWQDGHSSHPHSQHSCPHHLLLVPQPLRFSLRRLYRP